MDVSIKISDKHVKCRVNSIIYTGINWYLKRDLERLEVSIS